MQGSSPLSGHRVISVGHTLPSLYTIAILRDLGAEITRIERAPSAPGGLRYEGVAGSFPNRSLVAGTGLCALNLKMPAGRDAFLRMARQSDVVLEAFRPGVAARLGIGYETLAQENPGLVYAAISGYGQDGPCRDRVGHDINYLATSGVLHLTGQPGGPPGVPGGTAGDNMAGVNAALNVLAALYARKATGRGQLLDVAIVDGPLFLMSAELEHFWQTGRSRSKGDTHLSGRYPWYHLFETKDGGWLSIGAVEPAFYARLCQLMGRPDLASRQFASDGELAELFRFFREQFRTRTRDEWAALLAAEETCVAPVLTPGEAARAPQNERMFRREPGQPAPLVRSPVRMPPAAIGPERDTAATLASFGLSRSAIAELRRQGAIG